jgi:hypothetical protein
VPATLPLAVVTGSPGMAIIGPALARVVDANSAPRHRNRQRLGQRKGHRHRLPFEALLSSLLTRTMAL